MKEEALDRAKWRARFGRGFGPVARQTTNERPTCYSLQTVVSVFFVECLDCKRCILPSCAADWLINIEIMGRSSFPHSKYEC